MKEEKHILCSSCKKHGKNGKCFYGVVRKYDVPRIVGDKVHRTFCTAYEDCKKG